MSHGSPAWNALILLYGLSHSNPKLSHLVWLCGRGRCLHILLRIIFYLCDEKGEEKKIISFVAVAFKDAINFLSALLISSAEKSTHSPIWCCALLMKDQDASLILLSGDLHSFGSPLNVTGKNLMPLTSSSSHTRSQKTSRLALGKFCQQSSAEVRGFLLLLTACGLLLLYFRSWCKTLKIKIWDKVSQSYSRFWGRQRIWVSLAIFILPWYVSGFIYTCYESHSRH